MIARWTIAGIAAALAAPIGFEFSQSLQTLPKAAAIPLAPEDLSRGTQRISAFQPGEFLRFDIDYGVIPAGTATLEVKHSKSGLWEIRAEGRSRRFYDWVFPVRDTYISTFDPETQLPVRFVRNISEGGYRLEQDYRFNWSAGWCETEEHRRRTPDVEDAFQMPGRMQDMVSAFCVARNMDFSELEMGQTFSIPTLVDGETYDLRIAYGGKALKEAAGREWSCLVFHPVIQEGRIWSSPDDLTLWISDDSRHLPICVESDLLVGTIRMTLKDCTLP